MYSKELAAKHFTTCAVHIVDQLWPRAGDRNMVTELTEETVPMLCLWTLLRWERKVGLVVLDKIGVDLNPLAHDIDEALDAACADVLEQTGPRKFQTLGSEHYIVIDERKPLMPLLAAAEHESIGLGHNWVGSEHLLLAIIKLANPRLRSVLERYHVEYEAVRQAIVHILAN